MGDVERLVFTHAPETDLRAMYEVLAAWAVEDRPGGQRPPYEACLARWRDRDELGFEPPRFAVAREGGQIVGYVQAQVSEENANRHLALINVVVLPSHRRQGIGTTLLRAVPDLTSGRTIAESWAVFQGTTGEAFAAAHGFRTVTSMTRQRLDVTELPEVGELPAGYELVTWTSRTPDEFVEAYVAGLNAFGDAPFGNTVLDSGGYTAERVRREEANALATGNDRWVVLVLHGDEIAGVTVVERYASVPTTAEQLHTVVVPAHRGKGLGWLMKARMMHELTGIEVILTRTSSQNEHMLRVNHALGYRDQFVYLAVQARIADLRL